tara:strand:- start:86 stop:334 length:249 start_codon:yes stop_codon:yes gene_type:complete
LAHVTELNIFLGVDLNALNIRLRKTIGLENARAFFPLEFHNAGSVENNFTLLWWSPVVEMHRVRLRGQSRKAERKKKDRGAD